MTEELVIAGFGGQGVLSMGKFIALSGIMEDKEVSWIPSYGPEMRGGTANVTVVLSNNQISSPIVNKYDTAILLNQQSMDKFEETVKPGGFLIYDRNGIINKPTRSDIEIFSIDAAKEAAEVGSTRTYNMIMLGAYVKAKGIVSFENVIEGLRKGLPQRYHKLLPMNEAAIKRGMEVVSKVSELSV